MTIREMAREYRAQVGLLDGRIRQLRGTEPANEREREALDRRIYILTQLMRETRSVTLYLEHYYERGPRHGGRRAI